MMKSNNDSPGKRLFNEHATFLLCPNEFGARGTVRDQYRPAKLRQDPFKRLLRIVLQSTADEMMPNQCFLASSGGREIHNKLVAAFADASGSKLRVKERTLTFHMNEESLEDRHSVKRMPDTGIDMELINVYLWQAKVFALPLVTKSNRKVRGTTRSNVMGPFDWPGIHEYEQVPTAKIASYLGGAEISDEEDDDDDCSGAEDAKKRKERPMFFYELPPDATAELHHRLEPCACFALTSGTGAMILHHLKDRKPVWAVCLSKEHLKLLERIIDKHVWSWMLDASSDMKNLDLIQLYAKSKIPIPVCADFGLMTDSEKKATPKKRRRKPSASPDNFKNKGW